MLKVGIVAVGSVAGFSVTHDAVPLEACFGILKLPLIEVPLKNLYTSLLSFNSLIISCDKLSFTTNPP